MEGLYTLSGLKFILLGFSLKQQSKFRFKDTKIKKKIWFKNYYRFKKTKPNQLIYKMIFTNTKSELYKLTTILNVYFKYQDDNYIMK